MPVPRPRRIRLLAALVLSLLALLVAAAPAQAHAELIGSDPADGAVVETAPDAVTLTFTDPVLLTSQEISVFDAVGDPVSSASRTVGDDVVIDLPDAATLTDGTYVVSWNVLSTDGHPIAGTVTFSVGAPSTTVVQPPRPSTSSPSVTVLRDVLAAITYVGLLLAAGLAVFVALVLPRTWPGSQVRHRLRTLTVYAAGVGVLGGLLQVPVASTYAQGLELGGAVTGFDAAVVTNELLAVALLVVGLAIVVRSMPAAPPGTLQQRGLLLGALLALAGPALVGHTRAYSPAPLLVLADVLHLAAGATWLGGLVGLVVAFRALSGRELLAAQTLSRFSTLAGGLLLTVAATGSFLAWRILGSWAGFLDTAYGRLLVVKITIAVLVAALGGWNRWRTHPAVRSAVGFADRERAAGLLTRTVRTEAVLLVVLLGVAGFLVSQSPSRTPAEVGSGAGANARDVATAESGDLTVLAVLDPQEPGGNTLLVQVQDVAGEPYDPPATPVVSLRTSGLDLGEVQLVAISSGTFRGDVVLPRGGVWEVRVAVRTSRSESRVTTVRLTVPP